VRQLVSLGCGLDVASWGEVEIASDAGASPEDISFGQPVKPSAAISAAWARGVRDFTVDTAAEIEKVARLAPGSAVTVRLSCRETGADWPMGDKFGVSADEAAGLLQRAQSHGLEAKGVAFHVGSQQRRPEVWAQAVADAARALREAAQLGVFAGEVNLGGGWPAEVLASDPAPGHAAQVALQAAAAHLPRGTRLRCEPGRALVATAGVVLSRVVGAATRNGRRWVYLDAGVFHGLPEAEGERTRYPMATCREGEGVPTVVAGPTCDGDDVLYQRVPPLLPRGLREGDLVALGGAGAYTASYSSVGFNGLAPMRVQTVDLVGHSTNSSKVQVHSGSGPFVTPLRGDHQTRVLSIGPQ
jgi:ornithine decarboxylase